MSYISETIERVTASQSNFETKRDYVSISHCSLTIDEIIDQWNNGFKDSHEIRLRCYKGYQMEADLKRRIKEAYPDKYTEAPEVTAFGGIVKGHPDFCFDGFPGDCKAVAIDEHLPVGRVPRKVYFQMQGYMLYMNKNKALVVYESRATGKLCDFWISANQAIQNEINDKFQQVVDLIKYG